MSKQQQVVVNNTLLTEGATYNLVTRKHNVNIWYSLDGEYIHFKAVTGQECRVRLTSLTDTPRRLTLTTKGARALVPLQAGDVLKVTLEPTGERVTVYQAATARNLTPVKGITTDAEERIYTDDSGKLYVIGEHSKPAHTAPLYQIEVARI